MVERNAPRIAPIDWQGQAAWRKHPERLGWRMRLQKGDPLTAFERERNTYSALSAKGLPVPKILDSGPDFLVTADGGPTVFALSHPASDQHAAFPRALADAARSLAKLHGHGVAHGRPVLKDICWQNGTVTFIDWERSHPKRNNTAGYAEDVLVFFFSIFALGRVEAPEIARAQQAYISAAPAGVWQAACKRIHRLRWVPRMISPVLNRLKHKKEFQAVVPFVAFFADGTPSADLPKS